MFQGLLRPMHLLVLLIIVLLLFPKKLGELGKGLGEGIIGLRDAFRGKAAAPSAANDAAKDKNA